MYEFTTAIGLVVLIVFVQETETSARVVLTADPQTSNVMSGETVHLTCKVEGSDPSTQWEYSWKKISGAKETTLSSYTREAFSTYTLRRVIESDSAQYWCDAKTENREIINSPHTLTVTPPPPAVLSLNPAWGKFYPTEKVTLKCEIQTRQTGWSYLWHKDGAPINSVLSKGNEYTIPALDQSHRGKYSCKGRIPGRDVYTEKSNDVTLTVDALPPVVLTLQTRWTDIFNTERAALHCDIQDRSPVWMHKWYRDGKELPVSTAEDTYEILSAVQSDAGTYTCKGQHKERVRYTGSSNEITLKVNALPSAMLTLNPVWKRFYPTEKVTLKCEIQSRQIEWSYLWYKDGAHINSKGNMFTIPALAESHSGRYSCKGKIPGRDVSTEMSKDVTLTVDALPPVVLTLQTGRTNIFNTERAALHCDIQDRSPVWMHKWYRDGRELPVGTAEDTYEILSAVQSDSGTYTCKGEHKERVWYTGSSNTVALKVNAPPPAVLSLNPAWRKFYPTEKVTLKCEIQTHQTEWSYLWIRDGAYMKSGLSKGNEYTIPALDQSHRGRYSCKGRLPGRGVYTKVSNDETLTVDALPPVILTLQTGWTNIFNTERAALHCDIQDRSPVWMHKWYRDGRELPVGTAEDAYEILSAVQSDSGTYTCKGEHKERVLYTGSSNVVTLKVNGEAPKPLLTLDPTSGEIFTGDTVTLSCRAGTDPAGWEYLWYKEIQGAALTSTDSSSTDDSSYTIHSAAVSHGGEYWCRAGRGRPAFYTPYSDSLQLNITARPQAVLTLETAWTEIFRSDSLTLRCQVEGSSAEWNYTWYRDGRHLPLDPSGDRLTLTAGNDSYSSEYKCRGNRTGQPSYTEISEGFRANNIVSCTVENLARIAVGAAILLFLSVIVNEGFWRRARKMRRVWQSRSENSKMGVMMQKKS